MTTSLPAPVPTGAAAQIPPPFPSPNPLNSWWLDSLSAEDLAPVSLSLPRQVDFAVIGGGLTGASAALQLAKSGGGTVALIEARVLSGGATGRNGGICVPAKEYSWKIAGDLANGLALDTKHLAEKNAWELANARKLLAFHSSFRERNPTSPVFFEKWPQGCVEAWITDKEAETGKMVHKLMEEAGLNVSETGERRWEVWTAEEALERTGLVGVKGAVVYKEAFRAWGAKFVNAVASEAASHGATIHTHTVVDSVTPSQDAKYRWKITTSKGTSLLASNVLYATNGYTQSLLPKLPVTPLRGQILLTKPLPKGLAPFDAEISIDYGWLYGGTRSDGRICVGGCRNVLPTNGHLISNDSEMDASVSDALKQSLDKFEWLKGKWEVEGEWTGIQGWTPERTPIVGPVPDESLEGVGNDGRFVAAGFCGHGMPQVFLAGRCIANLALGKGYDAEVPDYLKVENRLEKWRQLNF